MKREIAPPFLILDILTIGVTCPASGDSGNIAGADVPLIESSTIRLFQHHSAVTWGIMRLDLPPRPLRHLPAQVSWLNRASVCGKRFWPGAAVWHWPES